MPGYDLAYVALVARDVKQTTRFLGEALGLPRHELDLDGRAMSAFLAGRAALVVFSPNDPFLESPARPGVHHLGLAAADPAATAVRHGLPTLVAAETSFGGRRQASIEPAATGGVRTRFIQPLDLEGSSESIERIDHLGIASDDNDLALRVFCDNLGCPLESSQTDLQITTAIETFTSSRYPAIHRTQPGEVIGGLRALFITTGDCELEYLQDYDASLAPRDSRHDRAGDTKGDQSAIASFVAKYGPGLAHVALKTPDIDRLLAHLRSDGWRLLDTLGRPGGRASRIGFVHPSNFGGGLLFHFVERDDPDRD